MMFHTFRQFGFIFAISIVSSLTAITLVSYARDQRSCDDFDAPGVAFALTLDYCIVAEAIRQIGLTQPSNGRATVPRFALVGNGLENFSQPESLVLAIDNSQYGFHLEIIYQDEGITDMVRGNYHPYAGNGILLKGRFRSNKRSRILSDNLSHATQGGKDVAEYRGCYNLWIGTPTFTRLLRQL
ncbi:hypothetical protein ACJA88_003546 [Fusarium oxysporum]